MSKREGSAPPPTVAEVLGRTARALRGDRKIELVARAAKSAGLNWGTGRIADLEAGRVSPTLPTLLLLCVAFSRLLHRPIGLPDLLAGDGGDVALNAEATVKLADLQKALGGSAVGPRSIRRVLNQPEIPTVAEVGKTRASFLEADARVAASLGLNAYRAAELMHELWGRSFSDERDRRGGPGANAQKRGRISRDLKRELEEAINGDDQ